MKAVFISFKEVFQIKNYLFLSLIIAFLIFIISVWLVNFDLLRLILFTNRFSSGLKLKLFFSVFSSIKINFPLIYTVIISVLAGINLAMIIYYFKKKVKSATAAALGFFGILSSVIGIGCVVCGSVILSSVFGLVATVSFLGILPFAGIEFAVLGILFLILSIYLLAQKIQSPLGCPVNIHH